MDESPDCREYAALFEDYINKERMAILAFGVLAILLFFIGLALVLLSLVLGNLKQNFLPEVAKLGTGFISAGASFVPVKEIVDRRVSLVPYYFVKRRFDSSDKLSPTELQENIELAREFLKKKLG
jgi:hypothetical protein